MESTTFSQEPCFHLNILIYSKDRPFQLQQLLKSIEECLFYSCTSQSQKEERVTLTLPQYYNFQVKITAQILYTWSDPKFKLRYDKLPLDHPKFIFHTEKVGDLSQLMDILNYCPIENSTNFVQIMVDDMLFYNKIDLPEILFKLYSDHQILNVHLKLNPGINYSHTTDKIMILPKFSVIDQQTMKYLRFKRIEASYDWNYPFDFCGSIYRQELVQTILDKIQDKTKLLKPNSFEFIGNQTLKELKVDLIDQPYSMCMNFPCMTVITVNKVQDIYQVPIYKFDYEEAKGEADVLEHINQLMDEGNTYDKTFYQEQVFQSVHVGDFKIDKEVSESPKVAVILPVYNDYDFLEESIKSILNQTYQNFILIILNDGSTETRVNVILAKFQSHPKILVINQEKNLGLAETLNHGIQRAMDIEGVKYIARMDSDDISLPQRLEIQVKYMEKNPLIDIIGTSVQLFGEKKDQKIVVHPNQDQLIRFQMLYFCCLAHPSIMMRASSIKTLKYESGKMEDYKLWLKNIQEGQLKFANIGTVLLKLRKHSQNQSSKHLIEDEIDFKLPYLLSLTCQNEKLTHQIQANPNILKEFITITGREVKSDQVFVQLKHRSELVQIFDSLTYYYTSKDDISEVFKTEILRDIASRKGELAMYAVANDLDANMLKCLLQGGQLKKLMGK